MTRKLWTQEEIEYLKANFADNYTMNICTILDRSYGSVSGKADFLGLKKSEAFKVMELQKQGERLKKEGQKTRFTQGLVAHNKGKKMDLDTYSKVSKTFFKKGKTAHNLKYDGYQRIDKDGYVLERIAKGKFVLKHRLVWEENFGKIPKGYCIVFKDKNKLNLSLDNLEMISLKENMKRNNIHRYPEEVKQVIRLTGKLKRIIKKKSKK